MTIRNDDDFRLAYEILAILSDPTRETDNPEMLAQRIIDLKRQIRNYAHREIDYDRRIIKDYGMDGYVCLERLPDDVRDVEEAAEIFDLFMTHRYQPSAYDCTGQAVTNWFKIHPRTDGFYAYHSVSFDL